MEPELSEQLARLLSAAAEARDVATQARALQSLAQTLSDMGHAGAAEAVTAALGAIVAYADGPRNDAARATLASRISGCMLTAMQRLCETLTHDLVSLRHRAARTQAKQWAELAQAIAAVLGS